MTFDWGIDSLQTFFIKEREMIEGLLAYSGLPHTITIVKFTIPLRDYHLFS